MADKLFVFPNHEFHKEARRITSSCPIIRKWKWHLTYDFTKLDRAAQMFVSDGKIKKRELIKIEEALAVPGGLNLANHWMETRSNNPIRQVGYRLPGTMGGYSHDFCYPTAFEVLAYGVGIMRPLNPPASSFNIVMGGDGLPMVSSHYMQADYGIVRQYYKWENGNEKDHTWKLQMTNLIFADTYGELEQLPHLPQDVLRAYLQKMSEIHKYAHESGNVFGCTKPIWLKHIQNGVWQTLPRDVKELLKRRDFILENTFIDNEPTTILKPLEYGEGRLPLLQKDTTLQIVK